MPRQVNKVASDGTKLQDPKDDADGKRVLATDPPDNRDRPTYQALDELRTVLGWDKEYDLTTRRCCGGTDWCNEDDPRCPVDEDANLYDKLVMGTMNVVGSVNRGVATFMLRLGRGFTVRVRPRRVVVDGRLRMVAMKPCKGSR